MIMTGEASIHGKVGSVSSIREKAMAGLQTFPGVTVNVIIPRDNAVVVLKGNTCDSAIWSDYQYIERNRQHAHSFVRREWVTLDKDEQRWLKVFAAETLYDVLELAIISPPGIVSSICVDGPKTHPNHTGCSSTPCQWYLFTGPGLPAVLPPNILPPPEPPIYPTPIVEVAYTIFPCGTPLMTGVVECHMWKGTGPKLHTNLRVRLLLVYCEPDLGYNT